MLGVTTQVLSDIFLNVFDSESLPQATAAVVIFTTAACPPFLNRPESAKGRQCSQIAAHASIYT